MSTTDSDWAELWQLHEQSKVALMMGQLDQMQMADAMAFHTLSLFILDLNARVQALENGQKPGMAYAQIATDKPAESRIILEKE